MFAMFYVRMYQPLCIVTISHVTSHLPLLKGFVTVGIKVQNSDSRWIKLFDFGCLHLMRGQDIQLLQVLQRQRE